MKDTYKIISKFECCGMIMVIVIMSNKAACVMPEIEYDRMIEAERMCYEYNG